MVYGNEREEERARERDTKAKRSHREEGGMVNKKGAEFHKKKFPKNSSLAPDRCEAGLDATLYNKSC